MTGRAVESRRDRLLAEAFTEGSRLSGMAQHLIRRQAAHLIDLNISYTSTHQDLVLGLVLDAPAPIGAYDLLERLRAHRGAAAPPTVYRALDFLLEQGFIHRIERLSAFIGCIDSHDHGEGHHHAAQFLICRSCGQATEIEDHALAHALVHAAGAVGFTVSSATIEAEGTCAKCRARADG
jgi:Fur family zinc uptake transcriptional regulator